VAREEWRVENNETAQALAQTVLEMYQAVGAENYIEILIQDKRPGGSKYAINLQRVGGQTPGQRLEEAEDKIGELAGLLAELQDDIDDYEQIRAESWSDEVEQGDLVLGRGDAIRAALEDLAQAGFWSEGI